MVRYLTVHVDKKEEDCTKRTVEQVLRKNLGLSKKEIRQAKFRDMGICKNDERCRVTDSVKNGDRIRVCLEESRVNSRQLVSGYGDLDVLYEDNDLLAVNKPAGMPVHPKGKHYQDTLANLAAGYFRLKKEECRVRPVGRLDKETSGIVVFAKNRPAAARLQKQRERGTFRKTYLAAVMGSMEADDFVHRIEKPIGQDPENRLKMQISLDGKKAVTRYKVEGVCGAYSLVLAWLETGRTHQIRVHMASLGHPLAGDSLYGKAQGDGGIRRAALHAWSVEMEQPFTLEKIVLWAEVPEDMKGLLNK